MPRVDVYTSGLCYASCCVAPGTSCEEICAEANEQVPTGLSHGWVIADEPFRTGEDNPSPCPDHEGRMHYLLKC